MPHHTLLVLTSAVLATVPYVGAQILSCADVECPIASGSTSADCTVVDKTFSAVGVAPLDLDIDGLRDISWVKGVGAQDVGSGERLFDQSFYLGTPPDFDFGETGACALFFSQVSERVRFGDDNPKRSQGTCRQALTDDCVSALLDRAKAVDISGLSGTAVCERLQSNFSSNLDSACASFTVGSRWTGITAQVLSGPGSLKPISAQQNASSNCWPIRPKSSDIRLVESFNSTGDLEAETLVDNFFGVTPILTVFFPGAGNSLVSGQEAQLTCLKTMDLTTASNKAASAVDAGEVNGVAELLGTPAMWVCVLSVVFTLLLV